MGLIEYGNIRAGVNGMEAKKNDNGKSLIPNFRRHGGHPPRPFYKKENQWTLTTLVETVS